MPQVPMWRTDDGELFETEAEHDAHARSLQDDHNIEAFLNETKQDAKPAIRTRSKNNIMEYLDWANRDKPKT